MMIRDVREHFPGLHGKTFLDSACVGLAPVDAQQAIERFLTRTVTLTDRLHEELQLLGVNVVTRPEREVRSGITTFEVSGTARGQTGLRGGAARRGCLRCTAVHVGRRRHPHLDPLLQRPQRPRPAAGGDEPASRTKPGYLKPFVCRDARPVGQTSPRRRAFAAAASCELQSKPRRIARMWFRTVVSESCSSAAIFRAGLPSASICSTVI